MTGESSGGLRVLCTSFAVALTDQATKAVVQRWLFHEHIVLIPGLLNLSYVQNTGAAWGILQGLSHWLVILSVAMLLSIVVFRRSFMAGSRFSRVTMGLVMGGIVGNLIDRVRLSYVVDFVDFHWGPHHFPAFNVADSAICIGAALYVFSQLRSPDRAP